MAFLVITQKLLYVERKYWKRMILVYRNDLIIIYGITLAPRLAKEYPQYDGIEMPSGLTSLRMINIFSGLRNFRPLTPDLARKIRLRPGLIYRSDALDKITHEDTIRLTAMGIRTIVDLRSPEEIDRHPDKSVPSVEKIFNFPIGNDPEKLSERGFDPDVYTKI